MPKYWFKCGLAALILWCTAAIFTPALATTYYVRTDGGPATQCDGKSDVPASAAPHCAWDSPMEALPPKVSSQPNKARIIGGDTLIIDSGSYMIGYSATAQTRYGDDVCDTAYPYACAMQPVPSGPDSSHPTVIKGASCSASPQLWGTQGVSEVLSLDGSSNVQVSCLELTDHSNCIVYYQPNPAQACNRKWGGNVGTWADTGIHAQDSANVTLQGLNIHGFSDAGVIAGRLSNWTASNVTISANGNAGWNGDLGGNNQSSSNSGTLSFDHLIIAWNGCTENYPSTTIINCWGQNEGGYGDGFSEAWTGGTWIFTNSQFVHNTQDGLDLLYANGSGSIALKQIYAAFNAGNQIKTSGTATLQNSIINGYCNDWAGYPVAGDGSSGIAGTMCRADGDALVMMFLASNETVNLSYNTVTGNGDILFGGGVSDKAPAGWQPDASDVTAFSNNIFIGQASVIPRDSGADTALDWYSDGVYKGTVTYSNNVVWHVKSNNCPATSICKDPLLTNETLAAFNAALLAGSPAIHAAKGGPSVSADYYGNARANPTSIGAVEYGSTGSGGGSGSPPPVVPPRAPGNPHCKWKFCHRNRVMGSEGAPTYPGTGNYHAPAPYTAPTQQRYTPRTPYQATVDRN